MFSAEGLFKFLGKAVRVVKVAMEWGYGCVLRNLSNYVLFCLSTSLVVIVFSVMFDFAIVESFRRNYLRVLTRLFRFVNQVVPSDPDIDDMDYRADSDGSVSEESSTTSEMVKNVQFAQLDLASVTVLIRNVVKSMVDDQVTKRFVSEQVPDWNIMIRARPLKLRVNWRIYFFWGFSMFFRYLVLLPVRLTLIIFTTCVIIGAFVLVMLTPGRQNREALSARLMPGLARLSLTSLGFYSRYHGLENVPRHGVAVANHTTPLDALVISTCGFFAFTGQVQDGFFKLYQKCLEPMGHLFFERTVEVERDMVANELAVRANDSTKSPILIFPEGTCINNTSVMMFRKRTFEVTDVVYPIAIKYHPAFGDAFWNSSSVNFMAYLMRLATSWTILCDVYFLPPMHRLEGESELQFTNRVRHAIAVKIDLVELDWDGQLKRSYVPPRLKSEAQLKFISRFQPAIMNMYTYTKVDKSEQEENEKGFKRVSSQHFKKGDIFEGFADENRERRPGTTEKKRQRKELLRFSDDNLVGLKNFKYWTAGFRDKKKQQ